jgi:hypothetical protein
MSPVAFKALTSIPIGNSQHEQELFDIADGYAELLGLRLERMR